MKRALFSLLVAITPLIEQHAIASQEGNLNLENACTSLLRNLLVNPNSLDVSNIDYSNTNPSTIGAFLIDYSAKNSTGARVSERAFCELTDSSSASIMSGARRDYSHLK